MIQKLQQAFRERYNKEATIIGAPGRVNLIGEHTDYNYGFVLPGAVDKKIYVAIAPNGTSTVNVFANQFNESYSFSLDVSAPQKGWMNYLLGVTYHIQQRGKKIEGVDLIIDGDIPVGAGMSSSAALCSAYGFALNELFQLGLSRMDLAFIGQKTEHTFVGLQCGIMDQFASVMGKEGHVLLLDCNTLEYETLPFHTTEHEIVLINSKVHHSLDGGEYNVRRQESEQGLAILKQQYPAAATFRDITPEQVIAARENFTDDNVYNRCLFVTGEISRTKKGAALLKEDKIEEFGQLMFTTHEGLSRLYDVSCEELDFLVELAKQYPAEIIGSRMMGGGFGGCTINIMQKQSIPVITQAITQQYREKYGIEAEVYVMRLADGTHSVKAL